MFYFVLRPFMKVMNSYLSYCVLAQSAGAVENTDCTSAEK